MTPSKAMTAVRWVYDCVECVLWALLLAFVLYFVIVLLPHLPENARRAKSLRALNIAEDNRVLCEKWGMKRGTYEHVLCAMDLQQLREKIKQEDEANVL
jgi:hypothetical protein